MKHWTGREKLVALVLLVAALVMAAIWIGVYIEIKDCEAKGGKRLRGVLEPYKCYDVSTLKVLP